MNANKLIERIEWSKSWVSDYVKYLLKFDTVEDAQLTLLFTLTKLEGYLSGSVMQWLDDAYLEYLFSVNRFLLATDFNAVADLAIRNIKFNEWRKVFEGGAQP